jgi:hypothetical protein
MRRFSASDFDVPAFHSTGHSGGCLVKASPIPFRIGRHRLAGIGFSVISRCIERLTMNDTATMWYRSSFCATGQCVEVAQVQDLVLVRDSKNPDQPAISFSCTDWHLFLDRIVSQGRTR